MAVKRTILVVDEEPVVREGLNVILRRAGYEVVVAATGEEALASLRRQRPDLIVLAMRLPLLGGFLERLRSEFPPATVPSVLVADTDMDGEWAMQQRCCGYVVRPINPAALLEKIQLCLAAS